MLGMIGGATPFLTSVADFRKHAQNSRTWKCRKIANSHTKQTINFYI